MATGGSSYHSGCSRVKLFFVSVLMFIGGIRAQESRIQYSIFEESQAFTFVGDVPRSANLQQLLNASQVSNLAFAILNSPNPDLFIIDQDDGILRTRKQIDREELCPQKETCLLKLDIAVTSPPDYFEVIKLVVEIKDTNDDEPKFTPSQITRSIPENTEPGRSFSIPLAEDLDSPEYGVAEYTVVSSPQEFKLKVIRDVNDIPSDLYLVLDESVDREERDLYQFVIAAVDGGVPPKTGTLTVDIEISDVNDHPPQFTNPTYQTSVKENATEGSVILRVSAEDPDYGSNGEIVYSFTSRTSQDYGTLFDIDQLTGDISLKSALDYEQKQSYTLQVSAQDKDGEWLPSEAKVIIDVQDVNDNPPRVNLAALTEDRQVAIEEGKPKGSYIAYISVDDPDTGKSGQFSCSLSNPDFEIDPQGSVEDSEAGFTLMTSKPLNREDIPQYDLDFVCADQGTPSLTSTSVIRVTVLDINDNPPVFSSSMYVAEVPENELSGAHVIKVKASDSDEGLNGIVRYSLLNYTNLFTVDNVTGDVKTVNPLDRETKQTYTLTLQAQDMGSGPMVAYTRVLVNVADVNDEPPKFNLTKYTFGILETAKFGTKVGQVFTTDPDSVGSTPAKYSLVESRGSPRMFSISSETGEIFTRTRLDRETKQEYRLVVRAIDGDDDSLVSSATVTIYVIDVNDSPPIFDFPSVRNNTVHISNIDDIGRTVTTLKAHDMDMGATNMTFYLTGDDDSMQHFNVHETSGQVLTRRTLEDIKYKMFTLLLLVKDSGTPPNAAQSELFIVVNSSLPDGPTSPPLLQGLHMRIVIIVCVISATAVIILVIAIVLVRRKESDLPKKAYLKTLFAQQVVEESSEKKAVQGDEEAPDSPRTAQKKEVSFSNDVSISDEFPMGQEEHKQIHQMAAEVGSSKQDVTQYQPPTSGGLASQSWDPADPTFQLYHEKPRGACPDLDTDRHSEHSAADTDSGRGSNEECDSSRPSCTSSLEHETTSHGRHVTSQGGLPPYQNGHRSTHFRQPHPDPIHEAPHSRHLDRSHDQIRGRRDIKPQDSDVPTCTNRNLLYSSSNVQLPRTAMLENHLNKIGPGAMSASDGQLAHGNFDLRTQPSKCRLSSSYV